MAAMTKDTRLTFRMPQDVRAALEAAAEVERRSVSDLALIILSDWLTDHGHLPAPERGARKARR
jgi:hypothetical protein